MGSHASLKTSRTFWNVDRIGSSLYKAICQKYEIDICPELKIRKLSKVLLNIIRYLYLWPSFVSNQKDKIAIEGTSFLKLNTGSLRVYVRNSLIIGDFSLTSV